MDRTLLPNATQFPNVLTDQVMPLVSGNEWKVIHYGVRYMLGHRSTDTLTIAQIAHGRQDESGAWVDHGTGIDEAEVKACLAFLCDDVHVFLREDRPRKPLGYRLNSDLSSINWEALEAHGRLAQPEPAQPGETPPAAVVNATPARPARSTRRNALFVEQPATTFHIDGSARPVLDQIHAALSSDEGHTFDHLLELGRTKLSGEQVEDIVWPLYRLWHTYGFRRLQNVFQSPEAASLDDVNQSCLVGALADMLDKERFGPITPMLRDQIIDMARTWPDLVEWQDAITIAVRINKRRLQTVETILKNKSAPPAAQSQGDKKDAGPTAPAQSRKRPPRRISEYSDEEISAAREAERGQEWKRPE